MRTTDSPVDNILTIKDDGIGMSLEVLEKNFWKPGSSGKKNELATRAGVVGTFGIGALANFGVCEKLEVITKMDDHPGYCSWVERKNLKIGEECVDYEKNENLTRGTSVKAHLKKDFHLNYSDIEKYLKQYIEFLPVKVFLNKKEFLTKKDGIIEYLAKPNNFKEITSFKVEENDIGFKANFYLLNNDTVAIELNSFSIGNQSISGFSYLVQKDGKNMGYRNRFGLANIPFFSRYNLGGVFNLSCLVPTAGREAISKESIEAIQRVVNTLEKELTKEIAKIDNADKIQGFVDYIFHQGLIDLSGNILVRCHPETEMKLLEVQGVLANKAVRYYKGKDNLIKEKFSDEGSILLILSQRVNKRAVQERYLKNLGIAEIPDSVQIEGEICKSDLDTKSFSLVFKIERFLEEDYNVTSASVILCSLSHGMHILVQKTDISLNIYLEKESEIIRNLYAIYDEDYNLFEGFVKDFIRTNLYGKIRQYIPSSLKEGTDALKSVLMKKRELYKYSVEDVGELEKYMDDFKKDNLEIGDIIKKAQSIKNSHVERVSVNQVGELEDEIPRIKDGPVPDNNNVQQGMEPVDSKNIFEAVPAILRLNSITNKKVLRQSQPVSQLNNFLLFLGLSDRLYKQDIDFFLKPHDTKIIWGQHKLIYIFSCAGEMATLYYSIDLTHAPTKSRIGSFSLLTTTIITKDRIFVPVPSELRDIFDVQEGEKKFYVTYDLIFSD